MYIKETCLPLKLKDLNTFLCFLTDLPRSYVYEWNVSLKFFTALESKAFFVFSYEPATLLCIWMKRLCSLKTPCHHEPIPIRYRKKNKIRALIAANVELNSLKEDLQRAPNKKSDIPIDRDNAIYLAKTCKKPYNICKFFTEPSHKGIYVLAGAYNKRFSLHHTDVNHWFNDSGFVKKGTQDLVLKTKFVSKDAALARNLLFTWMNYYVQGEQRFVLQYFGDPSTALREEGQGFGPLASDSDQWPHSKVGGKYVQK